MIYLPTFKIANFIIKRLVQAFGLNVAFYKLFAALFQTSGTLILTVGVIPTFRVIFSIFKCVYKRSNLTVLTNLLQRYNPIVVSKILEIIQPFWNICMKNPKAFKNLFYIYFGSIILGSLKLLTFGLIRFIFGVVLTSLGVLWSETLSGIDLLKNISEFIIYSFNDIFKNILSTLNFVNKASVVESIESIETTNIDPIDSGFLTNLTIAVLGLTGLVIIAMIGDYYTPEIVRSIPCAGSMLDSIYSFMNSLYEWYYGKDNIQDPKTDPYNPPYKIWIRNKTENFDSFNKPEIISRSSSGSSTVTSGSIPTPPATRTPTPTPIELPLLLDSRHMVINYVHNDVYALNILLKYYLIVINIFYY
jgi:hypothetical protein